MGRADHDILERAVRVVSEKSASAGALVDDALKAGLAGSHPVTLQAKMLTLDPDGTSFWAGDTDTGEIYRFDLSTGNKLSSFSTGLTVPPGFGGAAVSGLSIMPNIGALSQQTMNSTRWGFDAPLPGQPHGKAPIEDGEPE